MIEITGIWKSLKLFRYRQNNHSFANIFSLNSQTNTNRHHHLFSKAYLCFYLANCSAGKHFAVYREMTCHVLIQSSL